MTQRWEPQVLKAFLWARGEERLSTARRTSAYEMAMSSESKLTT